MFIGKQTQEHIKKRIAARIKNGRCSHTEATKLKISLSKIGKKLSPDAEERRITAVRLAYKNPVLKKRFSERIKNEYAEGKRAGSLGKHWKLSEETKARQGAHQLGEKNRMWKGGITEISWGFYLTNEYKIWKRKVKERDGCCVLCGSKERLEADHIRPRSLYPELKLDINNGRTLCRDCHKKTDTYAGRIHQLVKLQTI